LTVRSSCALMYRHALPALPPAAPGSLPGPQELPPPAASSSTRQPAPFKRPDRARAAAPEDGSIDTATITALDANNYVRQQPVAPPDCAKGAISVGPVTSFSEAGGMRFVKNDPDNWDFYDERMINLRRLLQMTFLADMFTVQQAAFNKWLGLSKYSRIFSDDPKRCRGFGTVLRWALYLMCIATCFTAYIRVTFALPDNEKGMKDYTQLPIKLTFLIFGIEVLTTMLCFSRAAKSFASLHIPRPTVNKVATGILLFCCSLFWVSYSVVFGSFMFYRSDQLNAGQKDFPSDMYRMHKNWIGPWMDEPVLLFLYASAMFVAFSVYIVSVSRLLLLLLPPPPPRVCTPRLLLLDALSPRQCFHVLLIENLLNDLTLSSAQNSVFGFYIWCIWMQARKLVGDMDSNSGQFKTLLVEAIPVLINEQKHLKLQWRVQIIIYIALDVLLLTCFSLELQFIIFNGKECLIATTPILLYMANVFIHLFSFLFGIAILNDSFASIEDAAWKHSGWRIAPHLRTPEQASACKDPEVCIMLLGLSTNKILFSIGPATIDWGFISTVSGLAATAYGLAIPSLGPLGEYRNCV
jgi:hypothetical protein